LGLSFAQYQEEESIVAHKKRKKKKTKIVKKGKGWREQQGCQIFLAATYQNGEKCTK
jgi:hypothetical protein